MISVIKYIKTSAIEFKNRNKLNIHTIGDSHAKIPWETIVIPKVNIHIHYLGPRLMYSVGQDKKLLKLDKYKFKNNDLIIFCFGEIDCRCHIWEFRNKGYKKVIDELVEQYFNAISYNVGFIKKIKVCVSNVVPPVKREEHEENSEYPFLGSNKTRRIYVKYMNFKLYNKCRENGYIFFDIYNDYCTNDGYLNYNLSDQNVHIGDPKYMIKFIKDHIL